jgi:hypothetical protein
MFRRNFIQGENSAWPPSTNINVDSWYLVKDVQIRRQTYRCSF